MKILITGGCGFIGSNFINYLINSTDNQILNYDKLTYAGNLDNLSCIEDNARYKFIHGDICDFNLLIKTFNNFNPDAVIHLAAESHVDRSIEKPLTFINTNIVGTANILNACLEFGKFKTDQSFRFLHISTDEVFGSLNEHDLFTELSPYDPSSPYSASKACSDHLVRAWHKTYGLPVLITNCSNNYGPYQFPEKLIPLMIANCIDEKDLPIYGNGSNIRDWLYVNDHCQGIYKVLLSGVIGQTYNIGGKNEIKNIDIVNIICDILDDLKPRSNGSSYKKLITFVTDRPGHDQRYAIDSSKIINKLKWSAKETFETGIKKTIKWYLENEEWWRNIQSGNYNQERLGLNPD